jgi:peptidoglycan/xylan/chitin deacetylase (PgdA/CDA1 family)
MWKYKHIRYVFLGISICSIVVSVAMHTWYPTVYLTIFSIWLIYILIGAFNLSAGIFTDAVCSLPDQNQTGIVITFDDGPDPDITPQVLDILKSAQATAVFFCIGKKMLLYPELVHRIVREGHILANHSYAHSNFIGMYSTRKVIHELQQTETLIAQYAGVSTGLYRPPFGVTNPNIAKAVTVLGLRVLGWNQRSFDTVSKTKEEVLKRITTDLKGGDIILFHDTLKLAPVILEDFLLFAKNKGFTFEVKSQLLS